MGEWARRLAEGAALFHRFTPNQMIMIIIRVGNIYFAHLVGNVSV
jgi:hypothetical protein